MRDGARVVNQPRGMKEEFTPRLLDSGAPYTQSEEALAFDGVTRSQPQGRSRLHCFLNYFFAFRWRAGERWIPLYRCCPSSAHSSCP